MDNKVLTIQDILERVLFFADEKSLAFCSVVSKQWSPLANRHLWNTLDSERPLLALLAPLRSEFAYDDQGCQYEALAFDPTQSIKWERFNSYAPFVKRLTIQEDYGLQYRGSVITTVALWRKTLSLLPNLEELVVFCFTIFGSYPWDFASLFLSTSLKEVRIEPDEMDDIELVPSDLNSDIRSFDAFLDAIPTRSPDLRTISLWVGSKEARFCNVNHRSNTIARVSNSCINILPSLHNLEKIILCPGFIQPYLLRALSGLQNIKCMEMQCDLHSICDPTIVPGIQRVTDRDLGNDRTSLLSLEQLLLAANFRIASYILRFLEPPILTHLEITVNQVEPDSNSHLLYLFSLLRKSPLLVVLHLEAKGPKEPLAGCLIESETFLQLSALTQIRTFSFSYPHQIRLSQSDFEQLVNHWPLLEELHLIATGLPNEKPYLSPHVLALLARHCPHLRSSTISINWNKIDVQMDEGMFLLPEVGSRHKFLSLNSVNFGVSPVEECEAAAIAVLLVDLAIKGVSIQLPGVSAGKEPQSVEESREREELLDKWKEIKKLMTIATHYRRQVNRLQKRVEMLEASDTYSFNSRSQSQRSDSPSFEVGGTAK